MAEKTYKVVKTFVDLKDDDRLYQPGDIYEGDKAERIKELLADDNKGRHQSLIGSPLIELVAEPADADEPQESEEVKE
jgi:hypothetical protein